MSGPTRKDYRQAMIVEHELSGIPSLKRSAIEHQIVCSLMQQRPDLFLKYFQSVQNSNLAPNVLHIDLIKLAKQPRQKVPAIKKLRERTGWGLKEAKDFLESDGEIIP